VDQVSSFHFISLFPSRSDKNHYLDITFCDYYCFSCSVIAAAFVVGGGGVVVVVVVVVVVKAAMTATTSFHSPQGISVI
jgi:hypothetical protein